MNILLDYWIFDHVATGGIYRYFHNLIKESKKLDEVHYKIACLIGNEGEDLEELNLLHRPFHNSGSQSLLRASKIISRSLNLVYSAFRTAQSRYDIYHPTYYSTTWLNRVKRPIAVTVYDMIHEIVPEHMHKNDQTSKNKKILCDKADIIFAISESTKSDLINILNIDPEKIKVTYLAGGFKFKNIFEPVTNKLPEKYLLFVGHRDGYKNFSRFFKACIPLLKQDDKLSILCTGRPFSEIEKSLFASYKLDQRVFHHFVNEIEFYTIYHKAEAMVFPSLYEGFGIPVLEAFSSDCPAILSRTSSLTEIGSDAAVYFDPYSEHEISEAISTVLYDPALKNKCIEKGKKRLSEFSWEKTFQSTKIGYQSIL
jgi:glycosyltransferase involved in cell wall biosynthesis